MLTSARNLNQTNLHICIWKHVCLVMHFQKMVLFIILWLTVRVLQFELDKFWNISAESAPFFSILIANILWTVAQTPYKPYQCVANTLTLAEWTLNILNGYWYYMFWIAVIITIYIISIWGYAKSVLKPMSLCGWFFLCFVFEKEVRIHDTVFSYATYVCN